MTISVINKQTNKQQAIHRTITPLDRDVGACRSVFSGLGLGGSATVPCMGGDQEFGARGEPGCETEVSRRPALHRPTKAVPSVGCCENRATEGILAMESPQRPPGSAPPRGGMVPRETGHGRRQEEEGAALVGSCTAGLCVLGFSQLQVDNILEKNPVTAQACETLLVVTIAVVALRSTTDSCVHSISISHWVF